MPKLNARIPKYSLHEASGRAIVTLDGTDYYLGEYDSPEGQAKYNRLIASAWLIGGITWSRNGIHCISAK